MTDDGAGDDVPSGAAGPRRLVWLPLVLLGLAWGLVVPVLAAQAALTTATFFGAQLEPGALQEQHERFGVALAVSAAIVVVGFGLSVWGRSNGGGWVFAVLLLPTLVLGLLWLGTLQAERPAAPAPSTPHQAACQEHSGGDTRCPGG